MPQWVPRPALIASAVGLPHGEAPCAEAAMFLEQATIVVGAHRMEVPVCLLNRSFS